MYSFSVTEAGEGEEGEAELQCCLYCTQVIIPRISCATTVSVHGAIRHVLCHLWVVYICAWFSVAPFCSCLSSPCESLFGALPTSGAGYVRAQNSGICWLWHYLPSRLPPTVHTRLTPCWHVTTSGAFVGGSQIPQISVSLCQLSTAYCLRPPHLKTSMRQLFFALSYLTTFPTRLM